MPGTLQANASPSFTPNTSPSPGPRQQSLALSNRTPACTPSRNNSSSTAQSSLPPVFSPNQFTRHQSHQALPYELSLPQFQASAFQQPAAQQFYYALPTFDTNSTHLLSNIASSVINMAHPANSAFNVPNWYYIPNHDQPAQPAQPAPIVPIAPAQQAQPGPIIPIAPAPPAQSARPSQAIPPIQHAPAIQGVSVCYAPIPPAATVVPARPVGQVWAPHLAVHQVAPQVAAPQVPQVINGSTVAPVNGTPVPVQQAGAIPVIVHQPATQPPVAPIQQAGAAPIVIQQPPAQQAPAPVASVFYQVPQAAPAQAQTTQYMTAQWIAAPQVVAGSSPQIVVPGLKRSETDALQIAIARANDVGQPQNISPADTDPSRLYWCRMPGGQFLCLSRREIDLMSCTWHVHPGNGSLYAVKRTEE